MVYDIGGKLSLQGTPVYYNEMFYFIRLGELASHQKIHMFVLYYIL